MGSHHISEGFRDLVEWDFPGYPSKGRNKLFHLVPSTPKGGAQVLEAVVSKPVVLVRINSGKCDIGN